MDKERSVAVDALRGIAALTVVFYHARETNWTGATAVWREQGLTTTDPNTWLTYLTMPFFFGFAAVPLFFVISGYCIHRPNVSRLAHDPNYTLDLRTYLTRRLWRIYPVLIAALFLTMLLDAYTRGRYPTDYKLGDTSWQCFFANVFTVQNFVAPPFGSNGPLWTLGMELHFYLLYPLLYWARRRIGPLRVTGMVLGISLAAVVVLRAMRSELVIFLPYWFTWVAGFLVAECECGLVKRRVPHWKLWVACAAVPAFVLPLKRELLLAEPFLAIVFASVVLWSVGSSGRRFWTRRRFVPFAVAGLFSYSLYAIHAPLLLFFRSLWQDGVKSPSVTIPLFFTLLCAVAAMAMFWLVERWSLRVPHIVLPGLARPAPATIPTAVVPKAREHASG